MAKRGDQSATIDDTTVLSSHRVAELLQVSPSAVNSWIDRGKLPGFRTPGGHRRVRVGDLRRFLTSHGMPVPHQLRSPQLKEVSVFVIDDEAAVIRALKRALELEAPALQVDGCDDGIEALLRLGAAPPDLVLLDIYMSSLDGFEVCTRLRKAPALDGVTVVAMTGSPSAEDERRIIEAGAQGYLVKPITTAQVLDWVARTTL